MAAEEALSITQAADALGVSPQRVHQMLREERLNGPDQGPGRAPGGVGRVWRGSLDLEIERRKDRTRVQPLRRSKQVARAGTSLDVSASDSARTQSAHAAALHLKVALDLAREALKVERAQSAKITKTLAQAVALLEATQDQASRLDAITDGYSEALTQLLAPADADSL